MSAPSAPTLNLNSVPLPRDPSKEEVALLFEHVEKRFPNELGDDRWYLVMISTLTSAHAHLVPSLYTYLIRKPEFSSSESRKRLMRRLREALVKLVSIIGVCKPLEAVFGIQELVAEEDREGSFTREYWQCDDFHRKRGLDWLGQIYQHNFPDIEKKFEWQKDFGWISKNITYGLYLSDQTILDAIETELVVLSGIMMQNLTRESAWHLRGCRRVGISREALEGLVACIHDVAKFSGVSLHRVPGVESVDEGDL